MDSVLPAAPKAEVLELGARLKDRKRTHSGLMTIDIFSWRELREVLCKNRLDPSFLFPALKPALILF
jgi:hypothetical protein